MAASQMSSLECLPAVTWSQRRNVTSFEEPGSFTWGQTAS